MSIVLDDKIMGIWYIQLADTFDMMFALSRDGDGYKMNGRTRRYASDDPWDERDSKHWFEGKLKAEVDDAEAMKMARQHMMELTAAFTAQFPPGFLPQLFELLRGDKTVEQFAELLQSMPWAHSMEATKH